MTCHGAPGGAVALGARSRPGLAQGGRLPEGGAEPAFNYHRFWAQADLAMAYSDYGNLFPNG